MKAKRKRTTWNAQYPLSLFGRWNALTIAWQPRAKEQLHPCVEYQIWVSNTAWCQLSGPGLCLQHASSVAH